jgi:hypothetical protein
MPMNAPLRALAPDAHRRRLVADMGRALVEWHCSMTRSATPAR